MFKQRAICLVTLVLLGAVSCQKHRIQNQSDPFDKAGKKLLLDTTENETLPEGTALALLVDEVCLKTNPRTELTKKIDLGQTKLLSKRSHMQTHKVITEKSYKFGQIQKIADQDPCIKGIGNHKQFLPNSFESDPYLEKQSHLLSINNSKFLETFFDPQHGIKKDVIVAIVDTGVDILHNDLKNSLWVNLPEKNGKPGVDDDQNGYTDDVYGYNFPSDIGNPNHETVNDHGTHVAGLLGATAGNGEGGMGVIGKYVQIMSLNVFGKNWGASTEDVDEAIRYAADNKANIINISVGGPGQAPTTAAAIVYALNKGSTVVVSAGNDSKDIDDYFYYMASYASSYTGMISVGASDANTGRLCSFSSYGATQVEILANGCDSVAPRLGLFSTLSQNKYGYKKGTSMAAPIVAGALALSYGFIRERTGRAPTPTQLENIFLSTCSKQSESKNFAKDGCNLNLVKLASEIDMMYPN